MSIRILTGDCRAILPTLAADSFDCCVTSPPYFGLRDYGVAGQIGLEPSLGDYLDAMVGVCREVRRALKPSGTLWLNIGDSYAGSWGAQSREHAGKHAPNVSALSANQVKAAQRKTHTGAIREPGLKPKDLMLVPARLALRLQDDGWWVRSEIIWHKPNPMPESVTDRPTCAHERVWLLSKSEHYFYDADAIREPLAPASVARLGQDVESQSGSSRANGGSKTNGTMKAVRFGGSKGQGDFGAASRRASGNAWEPKAVTSPRHDGNNWNENDGRGFMPTGAGANARNVWTIASEPYGGAHFAVMPPKLAERCILAGCPLGGHVLDPFGGAGTIGLVADRLGRHATLIELNPAYVDLASGRISDDAPLLSEVWS